MTPDVVVDIGNTVMKWGRCADRGVVATARLPLEDEASWNKQAESLDLPQPARWLIASVRPQTTGLLTAWLRARGDQFRVLSPRDQPPLRLAIEQPERLGIDRVLDALAANARRPPDRPALIVDAGSAVTVDWLTSEGVFAGGAILPGPRLMARALSEGTALLPLVYVERPPACVPGNNTERAVAAGIYYALVGGVLRLAQAYQAEGPRVTFVTGGYAELMAHGLQELQPIIWPEMTLEGLRLWGTHLQEMP
ncbi:MAG: hypothetical protein C4297_00060 [Gemmataceae bacterium]